MSYKTVEVLAELIENSNSVRRKDHAVFRIDINVYQDPKTKQYILSLQDSAIKADTDCMNAVCQGILTIGG